MKASRINELRSKEENNTETQRKNRVRAEILLIRTTNSVCEAHHRRNAPCDRGSRYIKVRGN